MKYRRYLLYRCHNNAGVNSPQAECIAMIMYNILKDWQLPAVISPMRTICMNLQTKILPLQHGNLEKKLALQKH